MVPEKIPGSRWSTKIKRGEVIGFVGDSGLTLGYDDYPTRPAPKEYPSWDETHLHFEVFIRIGWNKRKQFIDPYGIKGIRGDYPDSFNKGLNLGKKGSILWILDKDRLPEFQDATSSGSHPWGGKLK